MNNVTILIVTREKNIVNLIRNICHNHNITEVNSSIKAFELIGKQSFDMYLIDYRLPVISGIELLEEIKELQRDKDYTGVLAITSGTSYIFKEEFKNGLFHFILEKPVSTDSFKRVMRNAMIRLNTLKATSLHEISSCA